MSSRVVITGVGYSVPADIRSNTDPVFDWLHAHPPVGGNPFQGYVSRRVLAPGQDLEDIMVPAARQALADASIGVQDIDLLTGFGSLSLLAMPNPLALVHQKLGLLPNTPIVPIANDYANFTAGISLATALVETQRAKNAVVVCGSNWTRHVDYHTPQCISAGDGAGAVVVGRSSDPDRFGIVDTETITESALYGSMYMAGDERVGARGPDGPSIPGYDHHSFTWPYFHITDRGKSAFFDFGQRMPVVAVHALLARNGVTPADVTLIAHQASTVLLDYWKDGIGPRCMLDTLQEYADVPTANLPITLAAKYADIDTKYLVLLTLGVEFSVTAMLLSRSTTA
ncbi:MAG: hypothetical protein ABSC30_10545 [Acidimicrobiales bacterium]|jgi:3-oxoacyl-[acyl-carrier-protein] synthase-3